MQLFRAWPTRPQDWPFEEIALTIGTFDGVHRGHQWLISQLRDKAAARDLPSVALTFDDMPYCLFAPDDCPKLLTLPEEKIAAFAQLGIDALLIVPFDRELAAQNANEFVREMLVERLSLKYLLTGPDFALGRNRDGDTTALRHLGEKLNFHTHIVSEKLLFADEAISSTRLRGTVEEGHLKTAHELLGRPFSLSGAVVSGQQLGRTIGVPTINLQTHPRKVLPAHGVYACHAFFDDAPLLYRAALNIGVRPTVDGSKLQIEFHVLDTDIPVPPRRVRLEIYERLRDEVRFANLEALKAQMQRDFQKAREVLP